MNNFRTHLVYFALAGIVAVATIAYGISQFMLWSRERTAIADNYATVAVLGEALVSERNSFKEFSEKQVALQDKLTRNLGSILPIDENYTDLTRLFDNFFAENDKPGNPIVQSSLRFGKGVQMPGLQGISVLPISMNVEGTRDNFFKFLNFITNSGSLDTGTRLMSINSIQLNFPDGGEVLDNERQILNFTLDMNAYYQTPKVRR